MKKFMFASIGVLCLALSALIGFHIGNQMAHAQTSPDVLGYRIDTTNTIATLHWVMLANGDVYSRESSKGGGAWLQPEPIFTGNFWNGTPVPTEGSSFGDIKSRYGDGKR